MSLSRSIVFVVLSGITTRNLLSSGYLTAVAGRLGRKIVVLTTQSLVPEKKSYEGVEITYISDCKNSLITRFLYAILRRRGLFAFPTDSTHLLTSAPLNRSLKLSLSKLLAYPFPRSRGLFKFFHLLLLYGVVLRKAFGLSSGYKFSNNDIVVSTSPNTIVDFPVMGDAYFSEATTISLIKSFDNTSSKGMFPVPSDFYFCWNSFMSDEVQSIFGASARQCYITGVPQFDIYKGCAQKSTYISDLYKFREGVITVLFASNHPELGPDDVDLVKLMASNFPHMNFVVRVHFMDSPIRWSSLNQDNVFIQLPGVDSSLDPDMRLTSENFLDELRETIRSCDVVLNTCSTITLDSMCLGVDVALIAIDLTVREYRDSIKRFYSLSHYQPILQLNIFPVLDSIESLFEYLRRIQNGPVNDRATLLAATASLLPSNQLASDLFAEAIKHIES